MVFIKNYSTNKSVYHCLQITEVKNRGDNIQPTEQYGYNI